MAVAAPEALRDRMGLNDTVHETARQVARGRAVVRVSNAGIVTAGTKELVIEPHAPTVGGAVCVVSGGRLAFRRVLAIDGKRLRLRADVAPFEDLWDGPVLGCVRPRLIDRIAALDPARWTGANWQLALGWAYAHDAQRRWSRRRGNVRYTTRVLEASEWSRVRAFWQKACGKVLAVNAAPRQHVIGLFADHELVGANIHIVFGTSSYSAFTLVDRRYRGTGGGRKLIEHAISFARSQGLHDIYVHINARNLPSLRAYERSGFTRKGWWTDDADPLAAAERQWLVLELALTTHPRASNRRADVEHG